MMIPCKLPVARALAAVCLMITCAVFSCSSPPKEVPKVAPAEAMGLLNNDFAILVDVREKSEIAEGMAAQARSMPMSKIEANDPEWQEFLKTLPKDKQILLYCRSGNRSGKVAKLLAEKGFKVGNVGGFADWVKAGLPVRK